MTPVLAFIAAAGYAAGSVLIWHTRSRSAALWLAALGIALHAFALFGQIFQGGNLTLGVTEALSVFSWQAALLLWALCLLQPVQVLGVAIFPLAAVAAVAAVLWPTSVSAIPLSDWKIQLHVVLSLFSAGFLTLAAAQAVTLAVQDRLVHHATPNRIVNALPPLQSMEHLLFVLISLGFFILSLSLLSGLLFVDDLLAQHLAHKTVLSIVAWAIFGGLLWGRWRRGWRGRTAIRWTLSGYAVLILAYFGTKLILEQILSRHWT
jgi:ABC-type uncharacterized transport system permease subunit